MKLQLQYTDEDTGARIIVKNKGNEVFYHNSEVHDPKEFQCLTGRVFKLSDRERFLINSFYELAGKIE